MNAFHRDLYELNYNTLGHAHEIKGHVPELSYFFPQDPDSHSPWPVLLITIEIKTVLKIFVNRPSGCQDDKSESKN